MRQTVFSTTVPFANAAYWHHRHHLDKHPAHFSICLHEACLAARASYRIATEERLEELAAALYGYSHTFLQSDCSYCKNAMRTIRAMKEADVEVAAS